MFNEIKMDYKINVAANYQSNAQDKECDLRRVHLTVEPSEGKVQNQVGVSSPKQEATQVE